jgi:putative transposase
VTRRGKSNRRSPRLSGFDYSQDYAYYVTICTHERGCLFGSISNGQMILNAAGQIAAARWRAIPEHFPGVWLDAFVVMPNHLHGIVILQYVPVEGLAQQDVKRQPLGTIVGTFKSVVSREINTLRGARGAQVWQERFYDHIVRDEADLERIRYYIEMNPANWGQGKDDLYVLENLG